MTLNQSALIELLKELELTDTTERIRLLTQRAFQELINAEAETVIGAAPYERSESRATQRNGTRPRTLSTTLGADSGISKSEVSRICANLDQDVAEFRERRLDDTSYPYVFVDATYCKARVGRRVVSQAIVIAVGVAADGRRQVLGFQVGDTESEPFWTEFFRDLKGRGLTGVQLVISDAHAGLIRAIEVAFQGAAWQRCRVHFMRNVLARVPKVAAQMVAAIIRTIFVPRGKSELVHAQFEEVVTMLGRSHPAAAQLLEDAREDLLAFTEFPSQHWQQIWSTNPLERVNKEIKRRTNVVGTFPNPEALLRLTGHALIEQHDEWDAAERRYFSENSMKLITPGVEGVMFAGLEAA